MPNAPERGIILTTAELASEGVDNVLDAIAATGANAITLPTSVMVPATPDTGLREPPLDVSGANRTLDRPLWGDRITWVQRYSAHPPNESAWRDLPWSPPPLAPEEHRVDMARLAIDGARERGLRVHVQMTPYQLPGSPGGQEGTTGQPDIRDAYRPRRLVEGPHPTGVAYTGCMNHPTVLELGRVRLRELLGHYADVDGITFDWVEYPAYFIEKVFTCFCEHCQRTAIELGYDWDQMVFAARTLWDNLHTLREETLQALITSGGDWGELVPDPESMQVGLDTWLSFKGHTVERAIADLRAIASEAGASDLHISTSGFPLPWGRITGAAWPSAEGPLDSQRVKFYSFHWLMMTNWWSETALRWNTASDIDEETMVRAVLALFDMNFIEEPASLKLEHFRMPDPDEGHNLDAASYTVRLENSLARRAEQPPLHPIVHGYRPPADFEHVLTALADHTDEGMWVQRYGYLSDEKLDILRRHWS